MKRPEERERLLLDPFPTLPLALLVHTAPLFFSPVASIPFSFTVRPGKGEPSLSFGSVGGDTCVDCRRFGGCDRLHRSNDLATKTGAGKRRVPMPTAVERRSALQRITAGAKIPTGRRPVAAATLLGRIRDLSAKGPIGTDVLHVPPPVETGEPTSSGLFGLAAESSRTNPPVGETGDRGGPSADREPCPLQPPAGGRVRPLHDQPIRRSRQIADRRGHGGQSQPSSAAPVMTEARNQVTPHSMPLSIC